MAAESERATVASAIVETISQPLLVLDTDLTVETVNTAFLTLFGVGRDQAVGRSVFDIGEGAWSAGDLRRRLEGLLRQTTGAGEIEVEHTFAGNELRSLQLNAQRLDELELILLAIHDVTDQREAARRREERGARARIILALTDELRRSDSPAEIMARASVVLGRHLGIGRVSYVEFDMDAGRATLAHDWIDETDRELAGTPNTFRDYGPGLLETLALGDTVVIEEVAEDPRTNAPGIRAGYERAGVTAILCVPLLTEGRLSAAVALTSRLPRTWSRPDILIAEEVAERTRGAVTRARVEAALRDREERLSRMFESAPDAIVLVASDGRILDLNSAATVIHGCPKERLTGTHFRDWVPPRLHGDLDRLLTEAADGDTVKASVLTANGDEVPVDMRGAHVRFETVNAILLHVRDISEQVRAAAALRSSEDRYRRLFDSIDQGFCVIEMLYDAEGRPVDYRFLETNTAFLEQTGLERAIGRTMLAFAPAHEASWFEIYDEITKTGVARRFEGTARQLNRHYDVYAFRIGAPEDRRLGVLFHDITERQAADKKLKESEERLRLALGALGGEVADWDLPAETAIVSEGYRELFGMAADEAVTRASWLASMHPADRERLAAYSSQRVRSGGPLDVEFRVLHPTKGERWLASHGWFHPSAAGPAKRLIGIVHDITERKLVEAQLRESEERLRGIYETATSGIVIADLEGRIRRGNPAYLRMLDRTEEEVCGRPFSDFVHPEDRAENVARLESLIRGDVPSLEIFNRYVRRDGEAIWVMKTVSAIRDADGQPWQLVGLVTDMTERRRHEEQIHLLMREVNHRSKNMLALVMTIARQTAAGGFDGFIARFEERLHSLVASQDVLVHSAWKGAELSLLVKSQLAHFEDLIGQRIIIDGPDLTLSTEAAQTLGMAIHELATNAGKYGALSDDVGTVTITWQLGPDHDAVAYFEIAWIERGGPPVIAPARGGFGSTVIRDMVEMNLDADIHLEFARSGLVWQARVPASQILETEQRQVSMGGAEEAKRPENTGARGSSVLVVDDEALLALEIADVLTEAGFEVVGPAHSVAQALRLLEQRPCDAAVLDVNLGQETSEPIALALIARGTPFVVLSGYSRGQQPQVFHEAPMLAKPLRVPALMATLERLIRPA